jgi:hypothetical protein
MAVTRRHHAAPPAPIRTIEDLTFRERRVLKYVARFWEVQGRGPTLREIGKGLNYASNSGVPSRHVSALLEAKLLQRDRISGVLMPGGQKAVKAWVARMMGAPDVVDEWVPAPGPNLAAWRATRTAHGVVKGDLLFVDTKAEARQGELVVLMTGPSWRTHVVDEKITRRRRFPDTIEGDDGTGIPILPVRYLLRPLNTRPAQDLPPPKSATLSEAERLKEKKRVNAALNPRDSGH